LRISRSSPPFVLPANQATAVASLLDEVKVEEVEEIKGREEIAKSRVSRENRENREKPRAESEDRSREGD
jgi:hypothetical protein